MNQLKYDKIKLKKSDKASKKGNDCNVSQVSLDVNPVPVMYIFGYFRQKVTNGPFPPEFRGVTKVTKIRIFEPPVSHFWLFSAIFGNFRPQKVTIDPFDPGFRGSQKGEKSIWHCFLLL